MLSFRKIQHEVSLLTYSTLGEKLKYFLLVHSFVVFETTLIKRQDFKHLFYITADKEITAEI